MTKLRKVEPAAIAAYLAFIMLGAIITIVGANMVVMSDHFLATFSQVSLLVSANALGRILTSIISGIIADKFGRKKVFLTSILFLISFFIFLPLTTNIYMAMFLMFLAGMGHGMVDSSGTAVLFDSFKDNPSMAVSFLQVFICLGIFLSPTISSTLFRNDIFFGYYFWALGVLGIFVFIFSISIKFPSIDIIKPNNSVSYEDKFRIKPTLLKEGLLVGLMAFLFSIFLSTYSTWISTFSHEVIGLNIPSSIRILSYYSIGCIIGSLFFCRLLKKYNTTLFLIINPIAIMVPLLIYFIFRNPSTANILFFIVGIFAGIVIGLILAVTGEMFTEKKATASGSVMTMAALGIFLTPIITGFILEFIGIEAVYIFKLIVLLIFIIVTVLFKLRYNYIKSK